MYAVIASGGKQYRVQPGEILQVEKLEGLVGTSVTFGEVLMVGRPGDTSQVWLGKPLLSGATVQAEIVGQGRGDKVMIVKMKRRKQYRRTQGHRQFLTQLLVTALDNGAGEKLNLSDTDKSATLNKYRTNLAPKGLAMTPKTLGSRKRLAAAKAAAPKAEVAAEKAPAKKTTAAAKKTTA